MRIHIYVRVHAWTVVPGTITKLLVQRIDVSPVKPRGLVYHLTYPRIHIQRQFIHPSNILFFSGNAYRNMLGVTGDESHAAHCNNLILTYGYIPRYLANTTVVVPCERRRRVALDLHLSAAPVSVCPVLELYLPYLLYPLYPLYLLYLLLYLLYLL